jgi:uncharacterized SAM-binding protein YcdF (DUF218 family)
VGLIARLVGLSLLAAVVACGWDFVRFVDRADKSVDVSTPHDAEAVVALTGASDARISTGVHLASSLKLPLLISGVHVDTRSSDIARIAAVKEGDIDCCVTLGRAAATTEGNGAEVADWARRRNIKRLIVVTSEYHMDRALLELQRAMPEGEFLPHAVVTMKGKPSDWYHNGPVAKRLLEEWAKFRVASLLRPSEPKPGDRSDGEAIGSAVDTDAGGEKHSGRSGGEG